MLVLLVLTFRLVAVFQRWVARHAPSNLVLARVGMSPPRWRHAAGLAVLASVSFAVSRLLAAALEAGAPGWLNLVVLVATWDGLKFGWHAIGVALRRTASCLRARHPGRRAAVSGPEPSTRAASL
jgi:hypothetical protein